MRDPSKVSPARPEHRCHGIHVVPYDSEHDDLSADFEDARFDVVLDRPRFLRRRERAARQPSSPTVNSRDFEETHALFGGTRRTRT